MKIAKEYSLLFIVGMFVLAYILDLVVTPLSLPLESPYEFFRSDLIYNFPFSTLSIAIKSIALFLSPLWIMSFFYSQGFAKPIIILIWSSMTQLYAVQDIVTKSRLISMEWSLSLAASGFALFIPIIYLFVKVVIRSAHKNLTNVKMEEAIKKSQERIRASKESVD
jgi:hypothetical protein